jgi:hypothetical protein
MTYSESRAFSYVHTRRNRRGRCLNPHAVTSEVRSWFYQSTARPSNGDPRKLDFAKHVRQNDEEGRHWTLCTGTKVSSLIRVESDDPESQ